MNSKRSVQLSSPYTKCYSYAFKIKVVNEIENGLITKYGARKKYNIGGKTTILKWCRMYGTLSHKGIKVLITMDNETKPVRSDKQYIRELEKALAEAHLKILAQDTLIDLGKSEFGLDLRKKSITKQLKK